MKQRLQFFKLTKILFLMPVLLLLFCGKSEEPNVLATFDGGKVIIDEYLEYYLSSTKYKQEEMPTEDNLKQIVSLKAFEKMAVVEAIGNGVDKDSLYLESVENNLRKTLFFKYMREELINKTITDSLIKVYYDNFTPQYEISYIVRPVKRSAMPEFARSQRDTINLVYKLLRSGAKFEEMAARYSQDITTNQRGGKLGFVTRESLGDAALRATLDSLRQFSFSEPVRGYEAYYIMYKGERRDVPVPPYEEARGKIWQSLYRSRRHEIQKRLDRRFELLAEKYHFKVLENRVNEMLKKAGSDKASFITSELDFKKLTNEDMAASIATYDGGVVKVYELFEGKNREPENELEFREQFDLVKQRHLLAKHAMELGYQNDADIKEKMEAVRESLLRSFLYKKEVVDNAKRLKNIVDKQNAPYQEAAARRQLKEDLEKAMKDKYHFKFATGNFKNALKLAKEKKLQQNSEKKKKQ